MKLWHHYPWQWDGNGMAMLPSHHASIVYSLSRRQNFPLWEFNFLAKSCLVKRRFSSAFLSVFVSWSAMLGWLKHHRMSIIMCGLVDKKWAQLSDPSFSISASFSCFNKFNISLDPNFESKSIILRNGFFDHSQVSRVWLLLHGVRTRARCCRVDGIYVDP